MMHGRGKPEEAIVAGKPANEAERSEAEPVERRAEAKGNARQQSTHRTQSRGRVTPSPERIRQAAISASPFSPEVGAVCGKAARTVLCGGRSAMSVPTATVHFANPIAPFAPLRPLPRIRWEDFELRAMQIRQRNHHGRLL